MMNKKSNDIIWKNIIAKNLIMHAQTWGYKDKLINCQSDNEFIKVWCKITKTYYIFLEDEHYECEFKKMKILLCCESVVEIMM